MADSDTVADQGPARIRVIKRTLWRGRELGLSATRQAALAAANRKASAHA